MNGCAIIRAIPRFVAKLTETEDGHRLWNGARTKGGRGRYKINKHKNVGKRLKGKPRPNGNNPAYGKFWVGPDKKDTVNAHVYAAWLAGIIPTLRVPEGMHLAHSCKHGSLCMDCIRLVPAAVNLKEARTCPIRAVHPDRPKRKSHRGARSRKPGNPFSPAAKNKLTSEAPAPIV